MLLGFDAAVNADIAVAVGTLALAAVTGWLAQETRKAVTAAQDEARVSAAALDVAHQHAVIAQGQLSVSERQAELASKALEASMQPMLVSVKENPSIRESINRLGGRSPIDGQQGAVVVIRDSTFWEVSVPLRNIGHGVAVIRGLSLNSATIGASGSMDASIIATGERTRFQFEVPLGDSHAELCASLDSGTVDLVVGYTDIGGTVFRSRAFLHQAPDRSSRWYVRQVALYRDVETEPFAMSGPADP